MDNTSGLIIRKANDTDIPLILAFIKELADYEKLSDMVVATEDSLHEVLFGACPVAEALVAFYNDEPAGYALYFSTVSTFLGRAGIYLEDIFVRPHLRGKGIGKALFNAVAGIARKRECGRMEWAVLKWNKPSIDFYKSRGAEPLDEWMTMRLTGESLDSVAAESRDIE